jgi:hypothetical protein
MRHQLNQKAFFPNGETIVVLLQGKMQDRLIPE